MLKFTLVINEQLPCIAFSDQWTYGSETSEKSDEMANLLSGKLDAIGHTFVISELSEMVDVSAATFYQTGENIITVEPLKGLPWYAIFQPFKWYLWILILSTVPVCGIALYVLRKLTKQTAKKPHLADALWDISVILAWDSIRIQQPPASIIILLSSFMLATLVLITEYMGVMTSSIAKPKHLTTPINTVEEFLASDFKWVGGRRTDYYLDYFQDEVEFEERLVRLKPEVDEVREALQKLLSNPEKNAYFEKKGLIEWSICQHSISLNGRNFYYSKDHVGNYFTHFLFPKYSPYTEVFNRKILLLQDMGLSYKNQEIFLVENDSQRCHQYEEDIELVKLVHFRCGFMIMGIGYGLAFLGLLGEIAKKKYCHYNQILMKLSTIGQKERML